MSTELQLVLCCLSIKYKTWHEVRLEAVKSCGLLSVFYLLRRFNFGLRARWKEL